MHRGDAHVTPTDANGFGVVDGDYGAFGDTWIALDRILQRTGKRCGLALATCVLGVFVSSASRLISSGCAPRAADVYRVHGSSRCQCDQALDAPRHPKQKRPDFLAEREGNMHP